MNSATSALELAFRVKNFKETSEVIVPNFTCNSNISTVAQCNAIPVIVEVEKDTLGLDFKLTKKAIDKYNPKALQLVHVYGFPARDTKKIISYCKKKKVAVIEDASESLGAKIDNKLVGTFGDINVISTRSEKMIGVGEGGVVVSRNKTIFEKTKLFASRNSPYRSNKDPYWKKYYTQGEGYNYLMPHLLGAIGRGQIERFKKDILPKKIKLGKIYRRVFVHPQIEFSQKLIKGFKPVYWLNSIYFKNFNTKKVREIGNYLLKKGIEIRPGFWPMNELKNFTSIYVKENNISKEVFNKSIVLPSAYNLNEKDVKRIFAVIKNYLNK